jgi:hypothetical protein
VSFFHVFLIVCNNHVLPSACRPGTRSHGSHIYFCPVLYVPRYEHCLSKSEI